MSTANFTTPKYDMPLIVGGMHEDDLQDEYDYEQAIDMVNGFNQETEFFEIEIEGGYYQGFMFNVKDMQGYWSYEEIDELTDDDAEYFFGMGETAGSIKQRMTNELDRVREFLTDLKHEGFMELIKVAQFSNGEAVYKEVK